MQQVKVVNAHVEISLPQAAVDLLHADHTSPTYFQVLGPNGEQIGGDHQLPVPPVEETPVPGQALFRTAMVDNIEMRIAATSIALLHQARLVLGSNPRCVDAITPGFSVRVIFPLLAQKQGLQYEG